MFQNIGSSGERNLPIDAAPSSSHKNCRNAPHPATLQEFGNIGNLISAYGMGIIPRDESPSFRGFVEGTSALMFATEGGLNNLRTATEWHMDGTFKVSLYQRSSIRDSEISP